MPAARQRSVRSRSRSEPNRRPSRSCASVTPSTVTPSGRVALLTTSGSSSPCTSLASVNRSTVAAFHACSTTADACSTTADCPHPPLPNGADSTGIRKNGQVHVEEILLFILAAVAVVVAVRWISDRAGLPSAAILTLVGILYALLPGPNITLNPTIILTFVIPPLLYNAALESSLIDIRRNLRTVISLSVALVLATALLIGVGFALWVAGATLAVGMALGAAVAPPDPVAALAVGRKVGLPGNLVTLIQGEGLLNDATALTLLSVAVSAATGGDFSIWKASGEFLLSAAGGVVVGVAIAYLIRLLRGLRTDPISANAISLGTPFAAYLLGERLHVSGVLAVLVAGLFI